MIVFQTTIISVLLLFYVILACRGAVRFNNDANEEFSTILNSGQQQLKSLEAKTKSPVFGECWARAVANLKVGCRSLTEELQSVLALRLTDCFLQSSGYGPVVCDAPRKECLQKLSDRAFNAYTEFYTHTQSICYFLHSKLWQEETERTIDRLSDTSQKVTTQLIVAEKGQNVLLEQQRETLTLQETITLNLVSSKEAINLLMEDLKTSAEEQKAGLVTLFDQISLLQSWLVGEASWIDSLLFYATSSLLAFFFTSSPRTQAARLLIFFILSLNFLIERYSCPETGEGFYYLSIFNIMECIKDWVWLCRRVTIFLSFTILCLSYVMYSDYNILNHKLLLEIKGQNEEILKWIRRDSAEKVNIPKVSENKNANDSIPLPFHDLGDETPSINNIIFNEKTLPLTRVHMRSLDPPFKKRLNSLDVESHNSDSSDNSVRRCLRPRKLV